MSARIDSSPSSRLITLNPKLEPKAGTAGMPTTGGPMTGGPRPAGATAAGTPAFVVPSAALPSSSPPPPQVVTTRVSPQHVCTRRPRRGATSRLRTTCSRRLPCRSPRRTRAPRLSPAYEADRHLLLLTRRPAEQRIVNEMVVPISAGLAPSRHTKGTSCIWALPPLSS